MYQNENIGPVWVFTEDAEDAEVHHPVEINYYLELVPEGVGLDLLTHPLLIEGTHLVGRGVFQHNF